MEQTWLTDANGNRCSVEYFGSKEAAQKALDSLKECDNCTNSVTAMQSMRKSRKRSSKVAVK